MSSSVSANRDAYKTGDVTTRPHTFEWLVSVTLERAVFVFDMAENDQGALLCSCASVCVCTYM